MMSEGYEREDMQGPWDEGEKLNLKYNGEEYQLPVEEVVTLAQKGMNYDKILRRAEAAEEELRAREGGESDGVSEEMLELLEDEQMQEAFGAAVAGEDVPGEAAEDAAREVSPEEPAVSTEEDEGLAGFLELVAKYPDIERLPEEAAALVRRGVPPLYAYELAQNHALEQENARLRQGIEAAAAAERNRQLAPSSAESLGQTEESDPFLSGFQKGY